MCDIIGEWGAYQWSVTLFAVVYSALAAMTVVVGPMWTPELRHMCATDQLLDTMSALLASGANKTLAFEATYAAALGNARVRLAAPMPVDSRNRHTFVPSADADANAGQQDEYDMCHVRRAGDTLHGHNLTLGDSCAQFIYDDQTYGKVLTNTVSSLHAVHCVV